MKELIAKIAVLRQRNAELEAMLEKTDEFVLQHRLTMEKIVASVSTSFINISSEEIDENLNHALHLLGEFVKADHAYIILFSNDGTVINHVYEWCSETFESPAEKLMGLRLSPFEWAMEKLRRLETLYVSKLDDLPPEADTEKKILKAYKIQSVLGIPIIMKNVAAGFFGFNSMCMEKTWSEDDIRLLRLVGEIFTNVLARKQTEEKLEYRVRFQNIISSISTKFINLEPEEIDREIYHTLHVIGEFAGVDRSYVFLYSEDGKTMSNTHEYCAQGIEPQIQNLKDIVIDEELPWAAETIRKGNLLYIPSVADLPSEANTDKKHFQKQNIQSLITVPMSCQGFLIGFVGFDSVRFEKTWAEEDIKLLRLVGEIFANALIRKRNEDAQRKFEFIANSSKDFMTLINKDYVYEAANHAYRKCFKPEEHITGKTVAEIWGKDVFENYIKANLDKAFAGEEIHFANWIEFHEKGWGYYNISYYPYANEKGEITHVAVFSVDHTERKRIEDALIQSEELNRVILSNISDAVFLTDDIGEIIYVCPNVDVIFGYSADEVMAMKNISALLGKDRFAQDMLKEAGEIQNIEYQIADKNGNIHDLLVNVKHVSIRNATKLYVCRDITEHKLAENALQQSEERFRNAFEYAAIGVALIGTDGCFFKVNPKICEMFGYSDKEMLKKTFQEITHPKDMQIGLQFVQDVLSGKKNHGCLEKRYIHKDGHVIWALLSASIVRDAQGNPLYFISQIQNISERKHLEDKLNRRLSLNKSMTEMAKAMLQCVSINEIAEAALRQSLKITKSRFGYASYIDPLTGYNIAPTLTQEIWDECDVSEKTIVFKDFKGLSGWGLVHKSSLLTNDAENDPRTRGTPEGHIPIKQLLSVPALHGETLVGQLALANPEHDYTENDLKAVEQLASIYALGIRRKQAEDALVQAHRELRETQAQLIQSAKLASIGELAAGVAHELNQPLMVIRANAQFISQQFKNDKFDIEKWKRQISLIERNTERMMNIIDHLRSFARQSPAKFYPTDINKIIEESFLMIGEQLHLHNIRVEKHLNPNLPRIQGNPNQLEQVFLNLITNARDAIETKRENCLRMECTENIHEGNESILEIISLHNKDKIEILIKDTGCGIPSENMDKIFDPFFTTKSVGKGTGLGLSIAYGIIKDHQGHIEVADTGSEGTIFKIVFPVKSVKCQGVRC